MKTREEVIRALEICTGDVNDNCDHCPYSPEYGKSCIGIEATRDALVLLKKEEPRVMTLEEVRRDHERVVWIELDDSKYLQIGQYRGQAYWHANCATKWERFVTIGFANDYLHRRTDKYGKEWRCWTSRPTPEQIRDTPWEEAEV